MKKPIEPPARSRKTLPARKARKPAKPVSTVPTRTRATQPASRKPSKRSIPDLESDSELVRVFGER
jgi:hypothetical protein